MAYFSNGTDGMHLDEQCLDCPLANDAPCPILLAQLEYNYKQLDENGEPTIASEILNLLINEKGDCQMKPILDKQFGFTKHGQGIPWTDGYTPKIGDVIENSFGDRCIVEAFRGDYVSVVFRHQLRTGENVRSYHINEFTNMARNTLKQEGSKLTNNSRKK